MPKIAIILWLISVVLFVLLVKGGGILENDKHDKYDEN